MIGLIRYFLMHPKTPRPLRFSRLRFLRHWTIHRAAKLVARKGHQERELALQRQYNAMRAACEHLRNEVAAQDGGKLYRQATQRRGLFGGLWVEKEGSKDGSFVSNGGVPLEYARIQTDGPPRNGFDENWTR